MNKKSGGEIRHRDQTQISRTSLGDWHALLVEQQVRFFPESLQTGSRPLLSRLMEQGGCTDLTLADEDDRERDLKALLKMQVSIGEVATALSGSMSILSW